MATSEGAHGFEYAAILATRRWVLVSVTVVSVFSFVLALPMPFGQIPVAQQVIVVFALALTVSGSVLSRRIVGLWLLAGATGTLFAVVFVGSETWVRFDPLVAVFEMTLFVITLVPRWVGLIVAFLSPIVILTTNTDPIPILEIGGLSISSVEVRALQSLLSGVSLAFVWNHVVSVAQKRDLQRSVNERQLSESLRLQERLRVWRDTAIRVHETVLNDIRYVLESDIIEGPRLIGELGDRPRAGRLMELPGLTLPQIVQAAVVDAGFRGSVEADIPGERVESHIAPYLRAALIEILRNAERHGGSASMQISTDLTQDRLVVHCDSSSNTFSQDKAPGIGRSIVLGEALRAMGGSVEIHDARATIVLPRARPPFRYGGSPEARTPGRTVVSAVLSAVALGAFPYPAALLSAASAQLWLAGAGTLILLVTAVVIAMNRRTIPTAMLLGLAVLATLVPLLMLSSNGVCREGTSLAVIINIAGFALVSIAVWARSKWGVLYVAPWIAAAMLFLILQPSIACGGVPVSAISASVLVALVLVIVVEVSMRHSVRIESENRERHEMRIAQVAQSEAAVDVAKELDVAVTAAWDIMTDIATGAEADLKRREILRCLEARIRGTIQVDPRTSGAFTQAALKIIMQAVESDRTIQVLSLRDSQDRRPVSEELIRLLCDLALFSGDYEPTIQVFTYNSHDHLALTTTSRAVSALEITFPCEWSDGDVVVEIQGDETVHGTASILVTRPGINR